MKRMLPLTVVCLFAVAPASAQQADRIISGYAYTVDGDTFVIAGQFMRLAGIDAPQLDQNAEDRIKRQYPAGLFARDALAAIIADQNLGCRAVPQNDNEADGRGQLYVVCATAIVQDVGAAMVERGWALVDRSGETRVYGNYVDHEREAKSRGKGVWQGRFDEPWLHRVDPANQKRNANN